MAAMFKCPHCDEYFASHDGAQMHIIEVHGLLDAPITCQVVNSEVPKFTFQPLENLSDENVSVDWDFNIFEGPTESDALTSINDQMFSAIPEITRTIQQNSSKISFGYELPPNFFQQNMESGHGENSVLTSWNDQPLEPTVDVEKWTDSCLTKIQSYESIATRQNASMDDLGTVHMEIADIKNLVCYSQSNKTYHVKSGRGGHFSIHLQYENVEQIPNAEYFIRAIPFRSNSAFQHIAVDRICKKHKSESAEDLTNCQPLQALPGSTSSDYLYTCEGDRPSLIFKCANPVGGTVFLNPELIFMCNDSCVNSSQSQVIKNKEAARDLVLVLTLEAKSQEGIRVLARRKIPVWPKANICPRDLDKAERRKPKGAAAQKFHREKRLSEEQNKLDESKKLKTCPEEPLEMSILIKKLVEQAIRKKISSARVSDLIIKEMEVQTRQ